MDIESALTDPQDITCSSKCDIPDLHGMWSDANSKRWFLMISQIECKYLNTGENCPCTVQVNLFHLSEDNCKYAINSWCKLKMSERQHFIMKICPAMKWSVSMSSDPSMYKLKLDEK